ncbi:MAG TPA: M20/M25/M40 family metallo-hydrolase [Flavitalea sp.]|nr:M20/M25/M40 family metallo-hydrolase [Flavitalea sp.]
MTRRTCSLLLVTLLTCSVSAQKLTRSDKAIVSGLKSHISYLADDKLEGRRAGTAGEKLAMEYIKLQFEKAGLAPKGEQGWFQQFDIYDGKEINASTHFIVNGHDLKTNTEFFPLAFSPSKSVTAAVEMALSESGVPWFVNVAEMLEKNKENPHYDLQAGIRAKAAKAAEKGATALILYNDSDLKDGLAFDPKDRSEQSSLPVFYITRPAKLQYFKDEDATYDLQLKSEIGNKSRTGNNVIGYIDNGAPSTIVLGAHFDHLGYGEDNNSMLRDMPEKMIHNGADDNASGTAAIIELARLLKKSKIKSNNYLFIAFSAEELGLNGSKYFTEHPTIDLKTVNYMLNLDMVGRLNDSSKNLTVGGFGTSPSWSAILKDNKPKYLNVKFDSSGTGPSDHTSFYRKDIPVLFLFTGLHSDYHKPSDDADKINYNGEVQVINYITKILSGSSGAGKLAFTKTREQQTGTTARWSVSLGIMPDYTYSGTGVRVDGVSDDRPAKRAGIQTGDIILQLGDFNTSSMETYMQALSKFKKGDKAKVKAKRGAGVLEVDVVF